MIKNIQWKIKTTSNQSYQPNLKFIRLKLNVEKVGDDYWDSYVDGRISEDVFTVDEKIISYREYVEYNPVTLATLCYLEQLIYCDELPGRHAKSSQIMRCLDTLHRFWD